MEEGGKEERGRQSCRKGGQKSKVLLKVYSRRKRQAGMLAVSKGEADLEANSQDESEAGRQKRRRAGRQTGGREARRQTGKQG